MIDDPGFGSALDGALPDAKGYLRIEGSGEDDAVMALTVAAAGVAEGFLDRALIVRSFRETVAPGCAWMALSRYPVRSIGAIADGEGDPLVIDGYAIDIDAEGCGWVRVYPPGSGGPVTVTYDAGMAADWTGIPGAVRQGIIRLAAHLYSHRDGEDDRGPPAAVAALLAPWRRLPFARPRRIS